MQETKPRLRIALINNLYPPYIVGGNEMLARDVVNELRRRGHEVHVLTGAGKMFERDRYFHSVLNLDLDRKSETFLGGKKPGYYDLVKWHVFNVESYRAVRRTLKTIEPDVIVAWNLYMASMAPLVAASHSKLPVVIHVCDKWLIFGLKDIGLLLRPGKFHEKVAIHLLRTIVQPFLARLTSLRYIISISDFIRNIYIAAGFPADIIDVIHLGVPTNLFSPRSYRNSRNAAPIKLLYIGSLWEGKGVQVALRALGLLVRDMERDRIHLDIYGDGTQAYKDYLHSIVKEEGLERHVSFHGFVDRQRVISAYHSHDILVFPSIWDEPFAAVPVEAMSCGMAVVATSAGGTPEAIVDGKTGLVVLPNNPMQLALALDRLIGDEDLRLRLGEGATAVVRERFGFESYVDNLETYYRRVVGENSARGRTAVAV